MNSPYAFLPFALTAELCFILNDGTAQRLLALGLPVAQCAFMRFVRPQCWHHFEPSDLIADTHSCRSGRVPLLH